MQFMFHRIWRWVRQRLIWCNTKVEFDIFIYILMDNGLPIIIEIDMNYWYASARVGDLELIKIVTKLSRYVLFEFFSLQIVNQICSSFSEIKTILITSFRHIFDFLASQREMNVMVILMKQCIFGLTVIWQN